MKKKLFKIHSWIGIRLSILFFIVCFSGTIATLSYEIDWLLNKDIRITPETQFASRNEIVHNFKEKYPSATIGFWQRTEEPYIADIIQKTEKGKQTLVFVNPHSGEIQGEARVTAKIFLRDLHYFLFIPFQIGHFIVLFFGFLLLISLITALFFYKNWWRKLFKLQTGNGTLVFFRSLHRLVGAWSVPFMLLVSITGIWYFLERTNVVEFDNNEKRKLLKAIEISKDSNINQNLSYAVDYDKAIAIAEREIPNLKVGSISPPKKRNNYFYFRGKSDVALVRQRANRVYINASTYEVITSQKATDISTKMWLNDIADPLHFGYWGGLVTKVIWFFMGLGISSLIFSGIWITIKRKAIKRKNEKHKVMGIWRFINWGIYTIMLFFMYYFMIAIYHLSITTIIAVSLSWVVFLGLIYYIFSYRMKKEIEKLV